MTESERVVAESVLAGVAAGTAAGAAATAHAAADAAAAHENVVLQVQGLRKVYERKGEPDVVAVADVSFALHAGECLGIVGESGCGKSTTVKMITRLEDATAGSIVLQGTDITTAKGRQLREAYRQIQMVFQTPSGSFDPRRTFGQGIAESMRNAGMSKQQARARTEELLQACELPAEFADRYPHEASGGQCQRAAIARAMAVEPAVLVCDEATSALDVTVQKQVIELLRNLQQRTGLACLFICHDLALVQEFCHRVLVMEAGAIVEEGTPSRIIEHPQTAYTKKLIDAVL